MVRNGWVRHGGNILPRCSMYGIFTYIYHTNQPTIGKYTIHGSYGLWDIKHPCFCRRLPKSSSEVQPFSLEKYHVFNCLVSIWNVDVSNTFPETNIRTGSMYGISTYTIKINHSCKYTIYPPWNLTAATWRWMVKKDFLGAPLGMVQPGRCVCC